MSIQNVKIFKNKCKNILRSIIKGIIFLIVFLIIEYFFITLIHILTFSDCLRTILLVSFLHYWLLRYLICLAIYPLANPILKRILTVHHFLEYIFNLSDRTRSIYSGVLFNFERDVIDDSIIKNYRSIFKKLGKILTEILILLKELKMENIKGNLCRKIEEFLFFNKEIINFFNLLKEKNHYLSNSEEIKQNIEKLKVLQINVKDLMNLFEDEFSKYITIKDYLKSFFKFHLILEFFTKVLKINSKNCTELKINNQLDILIFHGISYKKVKSTKCVIFFNPNGLCYEFMIFPNSFKDLFYEMNVDVVVWNYRGYGQRSGNPNFSNMFQEGEQILKFLEKNTDYKEIGLYGYSLGGAVANRIAGTVTEKVSFLLADRTFSSIENIARTKFDFEFIEYLMKFFLISDSMNDFYYYNIDNRIKKIQLYDAKDEIIHYKSSLKKGIEQKIKDGILIGEIRRVFNDISKEYDKENLNEHIKQPKKLNRNDLIKNEYLFSNIEYDKFKKDFCELLILLGDRHNLNIETLINIEDQNKNELINHFNNEETKDLNLGEQLDFIISESSEKDEIMNNLFIDKELKELSKNKEGQISIIINLKKKLIEFFFSFTREGDMNSLLMNMKINEDMEELDDYLNGFLTEFFIWGNHNLKIFYETKINLLQYYHMEQDEEFVINFWSLWSFYVHIYQYYQYVANNPKLKCLKGVMKVLKKLFNYSIYLIYDVEEKKELSEIELICLISNFSVPTMNYSLRKNFKDLIKKRGELIYVNCGHNGTLSNYERDHLKKYLEANFL